jgi:hypothetical protein
MNIKLTTLGLARLFVPRLFALASFVAQPTAFGRSASLNSLYITHLASCPNASLPMNSCAQSNFQITLSELYWITLR